ncbi:unnamed protein product [Closterium sp. Yama58-4]|nr:unnamed protein product [Closterium sp. Yama58-4]
MTYQSYPSSAFTSTPSPVGASKPTRRHIACFALTSVSPLVPLFPLSSLPRAAPTPKGWRIICVGFGYGNPADPWGPTVKNYHAGAVHPFDVVMFRWLSGQVHSVYIMEDPVKYATCNVKGTKELFRPSGAGHVFWIPQPSDLGRTFYFVSKGKDCLNGMKTTLKVT